MVSPSRVVRVVAPNPSPMTLEGTNSYVLGGRGEAIVVDPGPANDAHLDALLAAAGSLGTRVAAIAITHGHPDHAPGAAPLAARTGAPIFAHPFARHAYDRPLRDGDRVGVAGCALGALDAPGHADDHLVFTYAEESALFTGDVIVGSGTVVIAPPHGDMRAYQRTLRMLRDEYGDARTIYGGHGPPIHEPLAAIERYIAHRESRERDVLAALGSRERTIPEIVATVYAQTPRALWFAAARQVLAYLEALQREGRVRSRELPRAATPEELAVLLPDLARFGTPAEIATAVAELGMPTEPEPIEGWMRAGG